VGTLAAYSLARCVGPWISKEFLGGTLLYNMLRCYHRGPGIGCSSIGALRHMTKHDPDLITLNLR